MSKEIIDILNQRINAKDENFKRVYERWTKSKDIYEKKIFERYLSEWYTLICFKKELTKKGII